MTGRPMTRMDLDHMACSNPNCTEPHGPLVFHSRCHMAAPTWVRYDRHGDPGVLEIVCSECEALVGRVRVAAEG